jgi:hypothetical protein
MSAALPDLFYLDRFTAVSLGELRDRLRADIRDLARDLFGEPHSTRGISWRWRKNLSLRVYVAGPRQGTWRDEIEAIGGDALQAIITARRMTFAEAVRWAAERYGLARPSAPGPEQEARAAQRRAELADRKARDAAEAEATRSQDIAKARTLWAAGVPAEGTLAEHHLIEVRGLARPNIGWPSCLRYHSPTRALLVAITAETGDVRSVQRILLDANGQNLRSRADGRKLKLATGPYYDACGRIEASGPTSPVLVHGEGFETTATPCTVARYEGRVWFGGIAGARPERGRINVILRDDDRPDGPAARAVDAAIARWRTEGHLIVVAPPFAVARGRKQDWNDLIREAGADAVRTRLAALIARIEPPAARPTAPMAQVREETRAAFDAWCAGEGAAHQLLKGAPAVGKSQLAVTFIADRSSARADFIRDHRLTNRTTAHEAGLAADAAGLPRLRLRYFGENHEAVAQTLKVARSLGLKTVHDGGYDRPYDPSQVDGAAVCTQPKRRILTQAAAVSMIKGACGDPSGDGPLCPDRLTCHRWARLTEATTADVVGMVLERAFDHYLPRELAKRFDFTIIDEGLDRVAYAESEMDIRYLADELFDRHPVRGLAGEPDPKSEPDETLTAEARASFARLRTSFAGSTGPYATATLDEAGLLRLIALTEARDTPDQLSPATSLAERERIAATSFRQKVRSLCGLLRAMLAGPGRVSVKDDNDGPVATIRPKRSLHPSIVDGRVLLIDATGEIESVRRFLPDAELFEPPLPTAPHQFAVQILTATGKRAMCDPAKRDYLRSLVRLYGDDRPGIITHLEHEAAFGGLGAILGHPGKLTSRNDWKDCATFFSFGVPSLSPSAAAAGGAARTGEAVPVEMPVRTWQGIAMRGGGTEWIPSQTYAHPAAREASEAVRERQAIQGAGGRPRGPNRGPDNPVTTMHVGFNAVPHMENDVLIRGPGQHAPERFVRAMARGFMVDSAPDRMRLHPKIYKAAWTAEYDRKSETGGFLATVRRVLFPVWQRQGPTIPMCAGRYWVAGRGHRREGRAFVCSATMLEDVKALLRERCRATDFQITDRCLKPDLELTRTQLNSLLLNPSLATYGPAEHFAAIPPAWLAGMAAKPPEVERPPPDG